MDKLLAIIVFIFINLSCENTDVVASYESERDALMKNDARQALGGNIAITDKEEVVNNCLMQHKFREVDFAFDNPQYFNFSHHFFYYKNKIRESKVYKIIKDMPKGAALHVHDMGILSPDYLLNLTYIDNLYVCFEGDGMKMKFSDRNPNTVCDGTWKPMAEARQSAPNVVKFDAEVRKHFTLVVEDPDKAYPCINDAWKTFLNYFATVQPLLTYRPIWEQYFYDVLKAFREQNLMYAEIRSILPNLYELDGTEYNPLITAKAYRKAVKKFVKDHPDFYGAKLIYAPSRHVDAKILTEYLDLARRIKQEMPESFAGFDIVGQEDMGSPLIEFVPQLKEVKDLNFFFHAGETDWYGTLTDENLFDAILLGSKRLGHAYALLKHPALVKEVIKRDIGLEVNVISNTVLSLLRDVRNHPLSVMLAMGLPVVLSSDDPGAWEADPISDDFYVAFVGAASRLSDLRLLKTLAINSLKYSALSKTEKDNAIAIFNRRWNEFVNNFQCSRY